MKMIFILTFFVFIGVSGISALYAAQDTETVNASCSIASGFDMSMTIKDDANNTVSTMDFGPLVHVGGNPNEPYISSKSFNVWLSVSSTNAKQYKIKQSANRLLTNANGNTIPQNAFIATTVPAGSGLNGGTLNQPLSMVGVTTTDRELFTSSAAGGSAWIQVSYGITTENGVIVPVDQPSGSYTSTITYTGYEL